MGAKKIIKNTPCLYRFFVKQICAWRAYKNALEYAESTENFYQYGTKYAKELRKLKGKFAGKRCFIIGNGPSLTVADLERLKNEYTFASNRIFGLYERTEWRPTFYCMQDFALIKELVEELPKLIPKVKYNFFPYNIEGESLKKIGKEKNVFKFYLNMVQFDEEKGPLFSEDISEQIYEGYTVTYAAIQIALYLGFKEVYLLGVDHSYSSNMNKDGKGVSEKDYAEGMAKVNMSNLNGAQLDKSTLAYKVADKYAREHGCIIYNATRGGALEAFRRINIDDILI